MCRFCDNNPDAVYTPYHRLANPKEARTETLICNAVFCTRGTGQPQTVLARIRGDVEVDEAGHPLHTDDGRLMGGKSVRIPAYLFRGKIPTPGEAIRATYIEADLEDNGPTYRLLRNAKSLSIIPFGSGEGGSQRQQDEEPLTSAEPLNASSDQTAAGEATDEQQQPAQDPTKCWKCQSDLNDQGLCPNDCPPF